MATTRYQQIKRSRMCKNRFCIPLDFKLFECASPFYQSGLGDRLEYELSFNDYSRVILAKNDQEESYSVTNIYLEYDVITHPKLAYLVGSKYAGRLGVYYDRVHRHRKLTFDSSDTLWNLNINVPSRSWNGILMLFESPPIPFGRQTESFYKPKIMKVEIIIEGQPNQLYSEGMRSIHQWDEIR